MKDRRLVVCCYLPGGNFKARVPDRHFDYLKRREDFRPLAPEVFDGLEHIVTSVPAISDPIVALQISEVLKGAFFVRAEVPRDVRAPRVGRPPCPVGRRCQSRLSRSAPWHRGKETNARACGSR